MPVLLDLRGAKSSDVEIGTSPISELQACLHSLAEPDHHLEYRSWLVKTDESLSPDLRHRLTRFAPLWARRRCRLLLPLSGPLDASVDTEIERIALLSERDFVEAAAYAIQGGDFDPRQAISQQGEFIAACEARSFSRGELAGLLMADPGEFRATLVRTLADCVEEFFAGEWERIHDRLRDEADQTRLRLRGLPLAELVSSVSPAAQPVQGGRAVRFDKLQNLTVSLHGNGVFLVPTIHGRPHLIIRGEAGFPVVVHYPVAWQSQPASIDEMQQRLTILSDPARLALCRHLVNEAITTSDLARRMNMTRPQVSRHLAKLRVAGVLTSEKSGRYVYHRVDVDKLMRIGVELLRAIVR
ncbi:ArsR/SmtB family transcription factor [Streptomyces niveus]|uniref:ArsR/SmtB family transcription factor n=1 Tax=Streptomyces niveus TaxID=193462 RepID=UPI00343251A5